MRVYRVNGIGHGTPVDPGSRTAQCGATGTYYPDSICSSYRIATAWELGSGTPPPTEPPAPTCFTAINYQHTVAGRAYALFGQTYARGSNQYTGLCNVLVTHTLRQTSPDYWVIADGQC